MSSAYTNITLFAELRTCQHAGHVAVTHTYLLGKQSVQPDLRTLNYSFTSLFDLTVHFLNLNHTPIDPTSSALLHHLRTMTASRADYQY